eukprot:12378598-Ditylum_brightwellii.AAC.1
MKRHIIITLSHSNEKWYWIVVPRTNDKHIPELGIEVADYHAHHKSHLEKCMYHATTGIIVKDNDITIGDKALMIANVLIGRIEKCKKDTFCCVYKEDGTHTMSRVPLNQLQKKGESKWVNLDITGSKDIKDGKSKMSKVQIWHEHVFPALDNIAMQLCEGRTQDVTFVCQEGGAKPNNDATYQ